MRNGRLVVRLGAWAICVGTLASCAQIPLPLVIERGTVIRNATVVGTRDGSLQRGMNVILNDGRIQAITARPVQAASAVVVVDGSGKYVVPGFLDMHTHAANTLAAAPNDFSVLLANGITGVREASGAAPLVAAVRRHNDAVQAGTAAGPEVLMMPTLLFAGQAPTEASARQFVRDRLNEGANYIKIVGGPPPAFLAAIDEARTLGSHAAGHLSLGVSARAASNAGYRSIEHLGAGMGLLLDCSRNEAAIRAAALATPVPPPTQVINPHVFSGSPHAPHYRQIIETFDTAKCADLAQTFARNGTWLAVTLIRLRTMAFGVDPAYRNDVNLKYVDRARRAQWNMVANLFGTSVSLDAQATLQAYYGLQRRTVKLMQENGVKILAGSDLGGGWVIPGFGLHQEFRELSAAGLTPLQVLQATTLHGAQFAGRDASMGAVELGKVADLVLLDANPLADTANLSRISGVFLRGQHYSRAVLDKMLADTAAGYASN